MGNEEAMAFQEKLDSDSEAILTICTTNEEFSIKKSMVEMKMERKKLSGKSITPSVIEPSFGLGRIIYCMYEHTYFVREVCRNSWE